MYGAFIVYDPKDMDTFTNHGSPYSHDRGEWILIFSDWYNVPAMDLMGDFLSPSSKGDEPVPDAYTI